MSTASIALSRPLPREATLSRRGAIVRWRGPAAVAVLLVAVAAAHGYNMLHYPYLTDDEGTYFSQGWSLFHLGRLAPYTYFYDHAPLGWVQIALWQLVTAGASFGYGLASGRVLMLCFQLGSTLLVVGIGRRVTGKLWVGLLAAALMSFSPYGIYYQRRILLDNIASFWLLASIYAVSGAITLRRAALSAAAFAFAVLSKEITIAAFPALFLIVVRRAPEENRRLAIVGWLTVSLTICSIYVLLALLKGELFPAGSVLGGSHPHVSLICSLLWQSSRNAANGSTFSGAVKDWAHFEPLLVIGGSACAAWLTVSVRRNAVAAAIGLSALLLWLAISHGGAVLPFYLLPILPLLALSLAITLGWIVSGTRRRANSPRAASALVLCIGLAAIGFGLVVAWQRAGTALFTRDPVAGQLAAERWIERNLPHDSRMIIDMSMWQDLHHPAIGAPFTYAEYDWKAGDDPAIRDGVFSDNWRKVDYVITTPSVITDTEANDFPVVAEALAHSRLVRAFDTGWQIDVRKVEPWASSGLLPLAMQTSTPAAAPACMSYGT